MSDIETLPGLGPKSKAWLNQIGITSRSQLIAYGPVRAYLRLKKEPDINVSLNLLYGMVGAVEGKHWLTIAKHEKGRLLMEMEGYQELEAMLKSEGKQMDL